MRNILIIKKPRELLSSGYKLFTFKDKEIRHAGYTFKVCNVG